MTHRRRLALRTRLAATFGLLFLLAGGSVIAVTVALATHSIDQARSRDAPALQELKAAINSALAGAEPSGSLPPGKSPAPTDGAPDAAQQRAKEQAAAAEELTRQRLVAANEAYSAATAAAAQRRLIVWSAVAAAVLLPAAAGLGWMSARRALRPLRDMTGSVRRVSDSSLSERVAMDGPRDELTELATSFDAMLERLEHAFDAQRRFAADASHELRTPLTLAATAVDVTLAKPEPRPEQWRTMAQDVRAAVTRAEAVLDGLLTLTRTQNLDHRREPVDLAVIAEDSLEGHADALAGLEVGRDLCAAPLVGDPVLLERLIANLVENAGRHNVPEGFVHVATSVADEHAVAVVENSGETLTAEQVAGLTEPFRRAAGRARSTDGGLGLGLTIASAVAAAHGGSLDLEAREGGGLVATVRLPLLH